MFVGRRSVILTVLAALTGALSTVEVSFDDGTTWQQMDPKKVGNHWEVTVRHPATGFVSLRASAEEGDGNTVRETVIRAYRLR